MKNITKGFVSVDRVIVYLVIAICVVSLCSSCIPRTQVINVRIIPDVFVIEGTKLDESLESSKIIVSRDSVSHAMLSEPLNDALIIMLKTGHTLFITSNLRKHPKAFDVYTSHYKDIINWLRCNGIIVIKVSQKSFKRHIERIDNVFEYRKEK